MTTADRPTLTPRGFILHADLTDRYGAHVRVQESSLATEPCVWIFTEGGEVYDNKGAAHLTAEQARIVRDALTDWLTRNGEQPSTDDARALFDQLWTEGRDYDRDEARKVFVTGYETGVSAAARAETTTATTEDAVTELFRHRVERIGGRCACGDRVLSPSDENIVRHSVEALADAGLLATARTRPTREQIEEAIEAGKVAHDDAVAASGAIGAQNAYIAEEVEALLDHDQPTEAEAGARALEDAAADREAGNIANEPYARMYDARWLRERAARLRGGAS